MVAAIEKWKVGIPKMKAHILLAFLRFLLVFRLVLLQVCA